jgi:2-hydroxychromene-2-carboxylate isomerase
MPATIEVYYDFRSPYAYFANHRIRRIICITGSGQLALATGID